MFSWASNTWLQVHLNCLICLTWMALCVWRVVLVVLCMVCSWWLVYGVWCMVGAVCCVVAAVWWGAGWYRCWVLFQVPSMGCARSQGKTHREAETARGMCRCAALFSWCPAVILWCAAVMFVSRCHVPSCCCHVLVCRAFRIPVLRLVLF